MLVGNYFCEHVSRLLDFDTDDMISFNTKYFFQFLRGYFFLSIFCFAHVLRLCMTYYNEFNIFNFNDLLGLRERGE